LDFQVFVSSSPKHSKQFQKTCFSHSIGSDLHPGKGFPIGSANASEGVIHPHLVGTDIGTSNKTFSFFFFVLIGVSSFLCF
jgi:hypothetical protein